MGLKLVQRIHCSLICHQKVQHCRRYRERPGGGANTDQPAHELSAGTARPADHVESAALPADTENAREVERIQISQRTSCQRALPA